TLRLRQLRPQQSSSLRSAGGHRGFAGCAAKRSAESPGRGHHRPGGRVLDIQRPARANATEEVQYEYAALHHPGRRRDAPDPERVAAAGDSHRAAVSDVWTDGGHSTHHLFTPGAAE